MAKDSIWVSLRLNQMRSFWELSDSPSFKMELNCIVTLGRICQNTLYTN